MTHSFDLAAGEVRSLAERAFLVGALSPDDAQRRAAVLQRLFPQTTVVVGLASVLVSWKGELDEGALLRAASAGAEGVTPLPGRHHLIELVLDGEDLEEACRATGLGVDEVATSLGAHHFRVGCVGFSPGFGYLTGLSGALANLPRRPTPRPRVAAGSFAVAAGYCAFYPQPSPGGWWLLGRTTTTLFDVHDEHPSLFSPGDLVSLRVVDELQPTSNVPTQRGERDSRGVPTAQVISAPPGTSIVDDGRLGFERWGVGPSGPFDPERAHALRMLLGNAPGAIEVNGSGLRLRFLRPATVAALDLTLRIDGREAPSGIPIEVHAGQELDVSASRRGPRGYVGFAGGPLVAPILGSMSTCSLSGVGPGFLQEGDVVGSGPSERTRARVDFPEDSSPEVLRVLAGPHLASLQGGVGELERAAFRVTSPVSRAGLRLESLGASLPREEGNLSSLPVVTGAVQLPPDGNPVILGPDRATLGGYPIIATVIDADLGKLGRYEIGDVVRFEVISLADAVLAQEERARQLASAVRGVAVSLDDAL